MRWKICAAVVVGMLAMMGAGARGENGPSTRALDRCLMLAGKNIAKGQGNFYLYVTFGKERLMIRQGDRLEYEVFLDPRCPAPCGGIDVDTDGKALRDCGAVDQNGIGAHPNQKIPAAMGKWYRREINLAPLVGTTTRLWKVVFEGDAPGLYAQFVDNVVIRHADGSVVSIYSDGDWQNPDKVGREGYSEHFVARSVERAKLTDPASVAALVDEQLKKQAINDELTELKAQVELARRVADQNADAHLAEHVMAANVLVERAAKNEQLTAEELESLIHEVHASLDHAHPEMTKYTGHLVGHAHIDFQWLWEWPETIQVCKQTFGQALKFMDEFPGFKFSQSSSALYAATEENFPDIFKGIQQQVAKGNWEIVGGRVCEGDENLISAESHARHFLYGQRYFRERFNGKQAIVGWEPDTFGHTWQMPQILKLGGCKYFYFCRGGVDKPLFWWEAPDGTRVLAFDEPASGGWYNGNVSMKNFSRLMDFAGTTGAKDMLWVYGVGNHGGGPTREQIEHARAFQENSALPKVKFSTATEFFSILEKKYDLSKLPVVRSDLNTKSHAGFYGVFTAHSDIKRWNRDAEAITESAEAIAALASRFGFDYPQKEFRKNWEDICWNHHHDTLPGTSIHASYNRSEAMYTRVIESSRQIRERAAQYLANQVKGNDQKSDKGIVVVNPVGWNRSGLVELPAGDWADRMIASGEGDTSEMIQTLDDRRAVMLAKNVPAFGYRRYELDRPDGLISPVRVSADGTVLENAEFRVVIDPAHGLVTSIFDKANNRETIAKGGSANRMEIHWEKGQWMSAWGIGEIEKVEALDGPVQLRVIEKGPVRATVAFDRTYASTVLHQTISLAADGVPEFSVATEWKELGTHEKGGPFLRVAFDVETQNPKLTAQIPFGVIQEPIDNQEHVALKFADLSGPDGGAAIVNDCKHGYLAKGNTLRLSLIRSSPNPDPHPNDRPQMARWWFVPHRGELDRAKTIKTAEALNHPMVAVMARANENAALPAVASLVSVKEENVVATGLKRAEDDARNQRLVLRFYQGSDKPGEATVESYWPVKELRTVNFMEDEIAKETGNSVKLRPWEIRTLEMRE